MELHFYSTKSEKEYNKLKEHYSNEMNKIRNEAYFYFINELNCELEKKIFTDWWNGKKIYNDEYRKEIDKEILYKVDSLILYACGQGFG